MTPETKTALAKKLIRMVNFKNVATAMFTGIVMWMGTILITSFREIKTQFNTDHMNVQMIVPAVRQLQKQDSTKAFQMNLDHGNMELIKASQDVTKDDIKELKGLIYQILRQTK